MHTHIQYIHTVCTHTHTYTHPLTHAYIHSAAHKLLYIYIQDSEYLAMKFTVQLFIFTQALILINSVIVILYRCNLFKERCSPTATTVTTCCDMTGFQAPSAVYQMRKCASGCGLSPHFTTITTDMNITGGGWIAIQ